MFALGEHRQEEAVRTMKFPEVRRRDEMIETVSRLGPGASGVEGTHVGAMQ
jgi:hypothetical protein